MDMIWVIREICAEENGFANLFDSEASYDVLIELADDKKEAEQFATLLYGCARGAILELVKDAYHHTEHAENVISALTCDGMSRAEAIRTLQIFYEAFGFPGYRFPDPSKVETLVTEDGDFRAEYTGEVRDGKEHGVGARTCYYDGEFTNFDECVWVDGVMCGYDSAREMEFGMYEDKKIGFVAGDAMVGKIRMFASNGEEFDDFGANLDIE